MTAVVDPLAPSPVPVPMSKPSAAGAKPPLPSSDSVTSAARSPGSSRATPPELAFPLRVSGALVQNRRAGDAHPRRCADRGGAHAARGASRCRGRGARRARARTHAGPRGARPRHSGRHRQQVATRCPWRRTAARPPGARRCRCATRRASSPVCHSSALSIDGRWRPPSPSSPASSTARATSSCRGWKPGVSTTTPWPKHSAWGMRSAIRSKTSPGSTRLKSSRS